IVIGGTSGIGLAIASAFRDAGAIVHATGATAAEIAVPGAPGIIFTELDVRSEAAVTAYAAGFTNVAAIVNCAGVNLRAAEFTIDGFTTALDINLTGAMRVAIAFRPQLAGGAMLAIGSVFSFLGAPHAPAYAASKSGLIGLVR